MTTTEDNKDQGAAEAIADALSRIPSRAEPLRRKQFAHDLLSALAEAGYTVVKTDALRELENAYVFEQVRAGNFGPVEPVPEGGEQ